MGCPYCQTGKMGLIRSLTAGEIVNQVYSVPETSKVTHVVFMGMGEPLDNLDEVLKACHILTAQWGFAISPQKITVSTVGLSDRLDDFLERSGCNLTMSLYSPFSDERLRMIPAEASNPSAGIIGKMKKAATSGKRRFSIAYMMIRGINDTERHLEELIRILKGSAIRVNILPFHTINSRSTEPPVTARMEYFRHMLVSSGISASVRRSRGNDISAACGLLAAGHIHKKNSC
jgi:23S rRNA (adenine2503-C2)-methyltransferase